MNCLPSNMKILIDILFLAFTLTNFWCGKMILSFAFKTFQTISWTVSCSFQVFFSENRCNHISFYLFQLHWYFSHMCHYQHLICRIFQFFATGFYFVLQLCIGQYTMSRLNQIPSGEFLAFFYHVFLLLSIIWSYCSRWRCSIHSL